MINIEEPLVLGYLVFREVENPGKKTRKVYVEQKSNGFLLGIIKWYAPWRKYVFYPESFTAFDSKCLDHIQAVLTGLMRSRSQNEL